MTNAIKVCHFCSTHVDAPYFSYLGKQLSAAGMEQHFVTLNSPDHPKWLADAPNVRYTSLGIASRARYPIAVQKLANYLRVNQIDLLQTHLFEAALIGLAAARIAGTRARIVSRHHLDETALLGTSLHKFLDKWSDQAADLCVVPSEATRRFMIDNEGQSGDNIRVVPYGFDFDRLSATDDDRRRVRKEFTIDENFVIGCVGRFFKNKGHRYLFDATARLIDEFPQVKLILLGDGDREPLVRQLDELGIGDHVIFAGFRSDIPACMKAMDLLVHPSLSESFGQVIVEAMCVGTPVVVTGVGGVPEIVENGETGIVVEPHDADALYTAMRQMLSEPDARSRFAEAGRESVLEKFNVERFIEKQLACYRELLPEQEKWR